MNYSLVCRLIGRMLMLEAAMTAVPLFVSFIYADGSYSAFLWTLLILGAIGCALGFLIKPKVKRFSASDAFAAAALGWIIFSLAGSLPYIFSGCFESVIDCVFESVSGFTTTGATILASIENLPRAILFWRSLSHFIGGMGVIVFMLAIMPSNASSLNLLKAETTGLSPDRVVPKIRHTAFFMYAIYAVMTLVLVALLLAARMPFFDAVTNAFSVAGTGGFSILNGGVGAYGSLAAEIIMTVFMFLFGVSFTLYFFIITKNFKQAARDGELRLYFVVVAVSIALIAVNLLSVYGTVAQALRYSSFQVVSVITTTGFCTADYAAWPAFSQAVLLILMITGCCAGSTGGGVKLSRVMLLFKSAKNEVNKVLHPQSVKTLTLNGKKVESSALAGAHAFFVAYAGLCLISVALVSIEGKDLFTNLTSVISMLSNVGPGLGAAGPVGNFSTFSAFSKAVLSFCMIAGRLEILPVLVLFSPSVWINKKSGGKGARFGKNL